MKRCLSLAVVVLSALFFSCQKSSVTSEHSQVVPPGTITTFKFTLNDTLYDWSDDTDTTHSQIHSSTDGYITNYFLNGRHNFIAEDKNDDFVSLYLPKVEVNEWSNRTISVESRVAAYTAYERYNYTRGDSVYIKITSIHNSLADGEFSYTLSQNKPIWVVTGGQFKNVPIKN